MAVSRRLARRRCPHTLPQILLPHYHTSGTSIPVTSFKQRYYTELLDITSRSARHHWSRGSDRQAAFTSKNLARKSGPHAYRLRPLHTIFAACRQRSHGSSRCTYIVLLITLRRVSSFRLPLHTPVALCLRRWAVMLCHLGVNVAADSMACTATDRRPLSCR